ncbi:MAG TPA: GNAT family N-acetyltransferase [Xanthobacteraceae bacterium]|nr:GNAT family N-acetyltransferase [Xanthobacteraceae bacterium]
MSGDIRDNAVQHRFELDVDDGMALMYYRLEPGVITLLHTEVPPALGGHGIGSALVRGVLDIVRARGLKVVPKCPFVAGYMGRHPEYNDLAR